MGTLRRLLVRFFLLGVIPLAAVAAGVAYYGLSGRFVSTENAYVRADVVAISSEIDGRVAAVLVDDNQPVQAGQMLFAIDPKPFEIALAASQAALAVVRQDIEALRAQYRESNVIIAAARERIRFLVLEYERQSELTAKGHGSRATYEAAEHALTDARQTLAGLRQKKLKLVAELAGDPAIAIENHPLYLKALAERDRVALDLDRTIILAPVDGTLGNVTLEEGEQIEAGDNLFPLVASRKPWIEANLKEVDLTHVRAGQEARIVIDSYPDLEWPARIQSISPATGAEFSLLPAQNATGNWVKVVQRVPVKLVLEPTDNSPPLRAGMTAHVEIDTKVERPLGSIIKRVWADVRGIGRDQDR